MITIKTLVWSNAFSYGADNKIDFVSAPLTQLVGKNGHGKSSIALVLEEVLFNKNSKSIKKADILNRYVKDKSYSIELTFDKDGIEYKIETRRGTAQTVKLYKSGIDISAHTATQTYKYIEEILGFDHKTFSQIVYQSNASSLEFLTAADTARKKFLIEILNLGKYTRAQEVFKETSQELSKDIAATQSQVNTVVAWLDKYSKTDLTLKQSTLVPELDTATLQSAAKLEISISGVETTNKKISQNNTYKQLQSKITLLPMPEKPTESITNAQAQAKLVTTESIQIEKTFKDSTAFVEKMRKLSGTCPVCLQGIDTDKIAELVAEQDTIQKTALIRLLELKAELDIINAECLIYTTKKTTWETAQKSQETWEKYHQLIDAELPEAVFDKVSLQNELDALTVSIAATRKDIAAAEKANQLVSAHNAKVDTISKQLAEMSEELETYSAKLHELSE